MGAPQLAEDPQRVLATPSAQFTSCEIPLRQRAARLGGIVGPPSKLLVRWCSFGAIELIEVQLEGKKRMPAAAFLNGFPLEGNEVLQ